MAAANKKSSKKEPELLKEAVKYVAGQTLFVNGRRVRKGKVFSSRSPKPGIHWIPLDKANAAVARAEQTAEAQKIAEQQDDQVKADLLMNEREGGDADVLDDDNAPADGK